jgi:hypothetical protein
MSPTSRARFSGVLPAAIRVSTASLRKRGGVAARQAERRRPNDLALAHRDAGPDLIEIFAKPDADEQRLGLAEPVSWSRRSA